MPNHVQNVIEPHGDENRIRRMLAEIQNDQYGPGTIDFNKILPMPPDLNIESGSRTRTGLEQYRAFLEVYTLCGTVNQAHLPDVPPEAEEAFLARRPDIDRATFLLGKQAYRNEIQYGTATWYEWCNRNWDTKWNAYGYEDGAAADPGCIRFLTAWSAPLPILQKLSERYPDVELYHAWADEGLPDNCGACTYLGGKIIEMYCPEGEEACAFAAQLWGSEDAELYNELLDQETEPRMGGMTV